MNIPYDVDLDGQGFVIAHHVFITDRIASNQLPTPGNPVVPMDAVDYLKGIHNGTIPIAGTGWEQVSIHPLAAGRTRAAFLVSRIVALNDAAARATLGV